MELLIDRQKVIKGLETCSDVYYGADGACSSCPYSQTNGDRCLAELVHDAIALLKEQDAVEPEVEVLNEIDRLYRCPRCHKYFFHRKQKYCDQCGQAVKLE